MPRPARKIPTRRTPRRQSVAELRELQRLALAAIRHPLSRTGRTQSRFADGRPMAQVAAAFIKPNDRLTSLQRLEIYNRQYWFRLLDCLWDDYPGLRAILGERKFEKLRVAYLQRYPSRSYTLRNLGSRLERFVLEEPGYVEPHRQMCQDMARFEWAQVVAFDAVARPPVNIDDLLGRDPATLRLAVQPHLTLLAMEYPLDDFVIAVKRKDAALRSAASNAIEPDRQPKGSPRRVRLPKLRPTFVAVHRHDDAIYYKRLEPAAYRLLCALRDGATVADACAAAIEMEIAEGETDIAERVRDWFTLWAELGWFCAPSRV